MSDAAEEFTQSICAELASLCSDIDAAPERIAISNSVTNELRPGRAQLKEQRGVPAPDQATSLEEKKSKKPKRPKDEDEYHPGDDEEDEDDDRFRGRTEADNELDEEKQLVWLRGLHTRHILPKHKRPVPELDSGLAGLQDGIDPYKHQLKATETIMHTIETIFEGLILGDPPGMGKTLSMLLAIRLRTRDTDGPSVIVVPPSCTSQWKREADRYFKPGALPIFVLKDRSTSPLELFKWKAIVCSYSYLASEHLAKEKFITEMEAYRSGKSDILPKRPYLCLLSDTWKMNDVKPFGPFLGLDEAHMIKNPKGRWYKAVKALRPRFESCIMMTGTPLDNTWYDGVALFSMLNNTSHAFVNASCARQIFTSPSDLGESNSTSPFVPRGAWRERYCQWLDAITLRRPVTFLEDRLPRKTVERISFKLPTREKRLSDETFQRYFPAIHAGKKAPASEKAGGTHWAAMVKALQYASHPRLVDILRYERLHRKESEKRNDGAADKVRLSEKEKEEISKWRHDMKQGDNARSARVDRIVSLIEEQRELQPDDAIVVMDESIYFLDVVEFALQKMSRPVKYWRYDGTSSPASRSTDLDAFNNGSGTRVLLATRGTCGLGLNIQSANVLIRCMPWWKVSWEEQADGRLYRPGQTKEVRIFELNSDAQVEAYRVKKREEKDEVNSGIMAGVTRRDDDSIKARRIA